MLEFVVPVEVIAPIPIRELIDKLLTAVILIPWLWVEAAASRPTSAPTSSGGAGIPCPGTRPKPIDRLKTA